MHSLQVQVVSKPKGARPLSIFERWVSAHLGTAKPSRLSAAPMAAPVNLPAAAALSDAHAL